MILLHVVPDEMNAFLIDRWQCGEDITAMAETQGVLPAATTQQTLHPEP
jgi:hypothetical protein